MTDPLERRINRAVYERDVAVARRAGAEEMRQNAAKVVTDIKRGIGARDGSSIASALDLCEREIRALPVE